MAESFGSLTIDTCFFIKNYVNNDTGDSLYLSTSTFPVVITQSYFWHTFLAQFLFVVDVSLIEIDGSSFTLPVLSIPIPNGISAVSIENAKNLLLVDSTFFNLVGLSSSDTKGGGALYITE